MAQQQKIGSTHTTVVNTDKELIVTFHVTQVVKVNKITGTVTLDNGGWLTPSTKTRMNQTSGQFGYKWNVRQKGGIWFVDDGNGNEYRFPESGIVTFRL
jgi:hypothetical protein